MEKVKLMKDCPHCVGGEKLEGENIFLEKLLQRCPLCYNTSSVPTEKGLEVMDLFQDYDGHQFLRWFSGYEWAVGEIGG